MSQYTHYFPWFFLLLLLFAFDISPVSAHETAENGTASLLVHVDPNDDPIVGEPAVVHVRIENTEPGYEFAKSDCELAIGSEGTTLLTQKLVRAHDPSIYDIAGVNFTFPAIGVYDITAACKPIVAGAFTAFDVDYDLHVPSSTPISQSETPKNNFLPQPLLAVLFGLIIAGSIFFLLKTVRS